MAEAHPGPGARLSRRRAIALTSVFTLVSRALNALISFISLPMTLHYLGDERFGVWAALSALTALLGFADLGMGNGLLNRLASAFGMGRQDQARALIANAYQVLLTIAVVLAVLALGAGALLPWADLLHVRGAVARAEVAGSVVVFGLVFAAGLPLGLIGRIQLALREGHRGAVFQFGGNVLSLLALWTCIRLEAGLPWLVAALAGAPLLAALANTLLFFGRRHAELRPTRLLLDNDIRAGLLRSGFLFLALQLSFAIAYQIDSLILARVLGPAAVAPFAVMQKYFSIPTILLGVINGALWPAYAEALGAGDRAWVRRTVRKSVIVSGLTSLGIGIVLIVAGPFLYGLWIGHPEYWSTPLALALALFVALESAGSAIAMYLNARHQLSAQLYIVIAQVLLTLLLKPWLCGTSLGAIGLPLGGLLAYAIAVVLPYAWLLRRDGVVGARPLTTSIARSLHV